jgi:hypothetical protein
LLSNNLSNDILCAHHVFLSYSNLRYLIMRWYYILYFYKCVCVYCEHNLCDIFLVKHSEFLWTFPKVEWMSQNKC